MSGSKTDVIKRIEETKLIVILRGIPAEKLLPVAEALVRGGVGVMEVTYTFGAPGTDPETAEKIRLLTAHFGDRLAVGAGTVTTAEQVRLTKEAGGTLIISPNFDPTVVAETNRVGLVSIPGAFSPTEVVMAHNAGADFVKLFPTGTLGVDYVKALLAPLKGIRLMAVGGVDSASVGAYLKAGACGFGVSSAIVSHADVEAGDYDAIARKARAFVDAIRQHG